MKSFTAKGICILGRQPSLGLAELESLYGAEHVRPIEGAALMDIPAEEINFSNLGGVIKVAKILTELPYSDWKRLSDYMIGTIPEHLKHAPGGKFTLGVSTYGIKVSSNQINQTNLQIKKLVKNIRPMRVVPNKSQVLSSAQVMHNKLTHRGGWELLFIANKNNAILAQTLFIQDIEAYSARDQARPKRDARVGMLPPKLAQIIVNLSVGQTGIMVSDKARIRILDPFCGTGVILQESLLAGYSVLGTDIDDRMVEYSKTNIKWLVNKYPAINGHVSLEKADATSHRWPGFTAVASEGFLGRPLSSLPEDEKLESIISDANTIAGKFLRNLSAQLKPDRRICIALPAWRKPDGGLIHLPLIAKLTDMGYNKVNFKHVRSEDLVYYREDQIVTRELLVLKKSNNE